MAVRQAKVNCSQVMRMLCDYLEGRLDSAVAKYFHQHTQHCSTCRLAMNSALMTLAVYFASDPITHLHFQ